MSVRPRWPLHPLPGPWLPSDGSSIRLHPHIVSSSHVFVGSALHPSGRRSAIVLLVVNFLAARPSSV